MDNIIYFEEKLKKYKNNELFEISRALIKTLKDIEFYEFLIEEVDGNRAEFREKVPEDIKISLEEISKMKNDIENLLIKIDKNIGENDFDAESIKMELIKLVI